MARLAGVILAVVFAVASVAKFRDPTGTRRSLARMGLPVPHLLAVGVPVVEVLPAVLLLVDPRTGGPWGSAAGPTANLPGRTLARNTVLVAVGVVATLD